MSDEGGGSEFGNKGGDEMRDAHGDTVGGGDYGYSPPAYSSPAVDNFSYSQPDFGNLDYLSAGGDQDGYGGGATDQGSGFIDNGMDGYGYGYGGGEGGGTGGGVPQPGEPGHAFSADAFTYGGPAGSSSVPNAGALNDNIGGVNSNPTATLDNPAGFTAPATGISAVGGDAGGGSGGGSGGSRDLSSKQDDNFLSKFGIKNPIGTALAGVGLGYSMMQGNEISDAQRNLSLLAAPALQTGRELTAEGRAVGQQGIDDLRSRAAGLDPNSSALMNKGTSLTDYVGTGKLPPEMQAQVDQAKSDARTARVSFYASKGMPTDPTKNTSLRSDLERIDRDAIVLGGQMADQLAKTGTTIYGAGLSGSGQSGNQEKSAADIGHGFITSGVASSGLASTTYANLAKIDAEQTAQTQKAIAAMAAALGGGTPGTTIKLG